MRECEALEAFPYGPSNPSTLDELDFSKCRSLKEILEECGGLTGLKKLDISRDT
jgi:hypothetical protein